MRSEACHCHGMCKPPSQNEILILKRSPRWEDPKDAPQLKVNDTQHLHGVLYAPSMAQTLIKFTFLLCFESKTTKVQSQTDFS